MNETKIARRSHGWAGKVLDPQRGWWITAAFILVMALLPAFSPSNIPLMTDGLLMLTMCYAWNLVGGFIGEFSFAHMIFWGIGSYALVELVNRDLALFPYLLLPVIAGMLVGAFVAGLIKITGLAGSLSLAILTTVLSEIALTYVRGNEGLGGAEGLIVNALPSFTAGTMFLSLVVICALAALVNLVVANTRYGRECLAIKDDQQVAQVAGINVEKQRIIAYVLSAGIFVIGGAYQAYYSGFASPEVSLGLMPLILVSLAVFIGGPGTSMGPLVGWLIIFGLQAAAQQMSSNAQVSLYAQLAEFLVALLVIRIALPRLKGNSLAGWLIDLPTGLFRTRSTSSAAKPELEAAVEAVVRDRSETVGQRSGVEIIGLQKSFGPLKVLRDVNFSIAPGEVVGIVGPNGAGKSTLCNLISGIDSPTGGTINIDRTDIASVPARKRASRGMGRSFQTPRLFQSLTLTENLMLGSSGMTEADAESALLRMGIPNSSERRGDDNQFFARRFTEVGKAALQGTSVLVLDEPLAGLTSDEHDLVLGIARAAANAGACVAIVEHLIPVLAPAVDRIVVLHEGRIVADGEPAVVLQDEVVIDAYLGVAHVMEETK